VVIGDQEEDYTFKVLMKADGEKVASIKDSEFAMIIKK
jgi:hypothetical protein